MSAVELFRRRPGLGIAVVLMLSAVVIVFASRINPSTSARDFIDGFALNLATEIAGIAITVGIVDWLLQRRAEHELLEAARPRVSEFCAALKEVSIAHGARLKRPSLDDLDRYAARVRAAFYAANELSLLLSGRRPTTASQLSAYARVARDQLDRVGNLAVDIQNAAYGVDEVADGVRLKGEELITHAESLVAVLVNDVLRLKQTSEGPA